MRKDESGRVPLPLMLLLLPFLGALEPLHAHKLSVFAYIEDGLVKIEVYFSSGSPAKNVSVKVSIPGGETVFEAKTGADGFVSFKPQVPRELVIVAVSGDGHRAKAKLTDADFKEAGFEPREKTAQKDQGAMAKDEARPHKRNLRRPPDDAISAARVVLGIAIILAITFLGWTVTRGKRGEEKEAGKP